MEGEHYEGTHTARGWVLCLALVAVNYALCIDTTIRSGASNRCRAPFPPFGESARLEGARHMRVRGSAPSLAKKDRYV